MSSESSLKVGLGKEVTTHNGQSTGATGVDSDFEAPSGKRRLGRVGRPNKDEENLQVPYKLNVYRHELQRLIEGQQRHNMKSRREYILYLLDLDSSLVTGSSTPHHDSAAQYDAPPVSPIARPSTSSRQRSRVPAKKSKSAIRSSVNTSLGAAASGSSVATTPLSALPPGNRQRRKLVYGGVSTTDKNLVDHDTFDFDPDQEQSEKPGPSYSFLQTSVNTSDHFGRGLGSPPSASEQFPEWEETLAKQKESEPQPLDFSDSMRLLPNGYYTTWSNGAVRLHQPPEPQPDKYGYMPEKISSRKKRRPEEPNKTRLALDIVEDGRWIVEFHELLKLVSPKCYRADCNAANDVDSPDLYREGAALRMTISCVKGHKKVWWTCRRLQHRSDKKVIYCSTNVILSAAVSLSGNSWQKAELLFKAMNLRAPSVRQFTRLQTLIVAPTVHQCWVSEQNMMATSLKDANCSVIVAGDGTFDSPGTCAMYCTYVQMITAVGKESDDGKKVYQSTGYVYGLNVTDKRHTDLKSPNMELAGFLRSLIELGLRDVQVDELVTDAHTKIKSMMKLVKLTPAQFRHEASVALKSFKDLPPNYLDILEKVCKSALHQLDVWHRAKNIAKALSERKVGRGGNRKNYEMWIRHIKNHWFFCSNLCDGDLNVFKETWFGLLHHIQGEHEWATSQCQDIRCPHVHSEDEEAKTRCLHGEEDDRSEDQPEYLDPKSEAFKSVLNVVTHRQLQDELCYYKNFRHTYLLENFNCMALKYAPKFNAYSYRTMIMKKELAAIDNNDAVHRPVHRDQRTAKPKLSVYWSRAASDWIPTTMKAPKSYSYIPHLMARILYERSVTKYRFGNKQILEALPEDPKYIAATIAKKPRPEKEQVLEHRKSRFERIIEEPEEDENDGCDHPTVQLEEVEAGLYEEQSASSDSEDCDDEDGGEWGDVWG